MSAASTGRGISTARSICIHLLCFPFSFLQILWHCGGTSMQCPFMILHLCGLQRMAVCLICRAQRIINRLSKLCRAHISSSHALHAQNLKTSTEKTNKTQTELQKLSDIRCRQSVSWTPPLVPRPPSRSLPLLPLNRWKSRVSPARACLLPSRVSPLGRIPSGPESA